MAPPRVSEQGSPINEDLERKRFVQGLYSTYLADLHESRVPRWMFTAGSITLLIPVPFIHGEARWSTLLFSVMFAFIACHLFGKAEAYRNTARLLRSHLLLTGWKMGRSGNIEPWEHGTNLEEDWSVKELLKLK